MRKRKHVSQHPPIWDDDNENENEESAKAPGLSLDDLLPQSPEKD